MGCAGVVGFDKCAGSGREVGDQDAGRERGRWVAGRLGGVGEEEGEVG